MDVGYHHRSIVWQIAENYSHCEFLIRLPGYCPMPAFRDVIDVPLVVRRLHKSRKEVRSEMGISEDVKLVILNFGGQPAGWKLKEEYLPPGWLCLVMVITVLAPKVQNLGLFFNSWVKNKIPHLQQDLDNAEHRLELYTLHQA